MLVAGLGDRFGELLAGGGTFCLAVRATCSGSRALAEHCAWCKTPDGSTRPRPRSCRAGPTSRTSSVSCTRAAPAASAGRFGIAGRFRLRGAL